MNQLEKSQLINEMILDQGFYFQALFREACNKHLLSDTQIERIQISLVELMGKEVERYTNDESSSIPVEKAQELFQSITYSIGFYLKSITDMNEKLDILKKENMSALFYRGMDAIVKKKEDAHILLKEIQQNCLKIKNYAYQDTISTGLSEFFHDYNIEFGANDIPASIDYPIFQTVKDYLGVEYIHEYLVRFTLEHRFMNRFNAKDINHLLHSFDKASEHILINLFELVLINAVGCVLLDKEISKLNITEQEIVWLQNNLEDRTQEELLNKFEIAWKHLTKEFALEEDIVNFVKAALPILITRLMRNLATHTLNRYFVCFENHNFIKEEYLEEGIPMEDELLRELMLRIEECQTVKDKLAIIREKVRSITDLKDLLDSCFYGEEYTQVFQLLSKAERSILSKSILFDAGGIDTIDYETLPQWQQELLKY